MQTTNEPTTEQREAAANAPTELLWQMLATLNGDDPLGDAIEAELERRGEEMPRELAVMAMRKYQRGTLGW